MVAELRPLYCYPWESYTLRVSIAKYMISCEVYFSRIISDHYIDMFYENANQQFQMAWDICNGRDVSKYGGFLVFLDI